MKTKFLLKRPPYRVCPGWIPASQAIDRLAKKLRGEAAAERLLLSRLLDGSFKASARCLVQDYDVFPVPDKPPLNKTSEMRSCWFSKEEKCLTVKPWRFANGVGTHAVQREVDFRRGIIIERHPKPSVLIWEEGETSPRVDPPERDLYYKIEIREQELEDFLTGLRQRKARIKPLGEDDPDSDNHRVSLTEAQWNTILEPILRLAREGRLEEEFGVASRGRATTIQARVLELLEDAGTSASKATRVRKAVMLASLNEESKVNRTSGITDEPT